MSSFILISLALVGMSFYYDISLLIGVLITLSTQLLFIYSLIHLLFLDSEYFTTLKRALHVSPSFFICSGSKRKAVVP